MNKRIYVLYSKSFVKFFLSVFFLFILNFSLAEDLILQKESLYIKDKINGIVTSNKPASKIMCNNYLRCSSPLITKFYKENQFLPVWSKDGYPKPMVEDFLKIISLSYEDGLQPQKYHIKEINAILDKLKSRPDYKRVKWFYSRNNLDNDPELISQLGDLDLTLSDAFFLYASSLAYGSHTIINKKAKSFSPSQIFSKKSVDFIEELNKVSINSDIKTVLANLAPHYSMYSKLREKLLEYLEIAKNGGFQKIPSGSKLKIGEHGNRVSLLKKRLIATGELDYSEKNIKEDEAFDKNLQDAVARFQDSHDLDVDGEVGDETLSALNVPIATRIRQIQLNMDRLRWLPNNLGKKYVVVNIPNFQLEVINNNQVVLDMPVIVGRAGWRSCILSSKITNIDINPFWYVPRNIAVKEILVWLKDDPTFLAQNGFKLFQNIDGEDQELDSTKVDWSSVNASNFNFLFRQDPGPLNPLGQIKFFFPNKCAIFLHDTHARDLFEYSRRDFSHGCIRIDKPLDLATYLLKDQGSWNKDKILNKMNSGQQDTIKLNDPVNIYIIYSTVWVDVHDVLQFRDDIYQMDNQPFIVALPNGDEE